MKYPVGYQTTSTQEEISSGPPSDMPDRGGPKPFAQTTSSKIGLSRAENPVAQFGAHPHMGTVQTTSTERTLAKSADSPYNPLNATKPQVSKKKE